ncbi:hypothetical protein BOW53_15590 [Solemya pervernicosa gill symbiont]|uniref:L,D-TPase catalytic domain-containing protein n=2 Tax=Gammaproteobacteria incertae sedis TaxID=118884 RepID=A0A1T2L002_9GAMM|nr:L,D-transpeptidase [Candidatus Reidiella endopervernicosa]OOZ38437.1 hypothetical protein BOW53_15590 [Solemya pervernicosa gill symbiont]QKQ27865.1 L,D-transpeptidase [Candidatus Reidiella endopervernicosa]
MFNAHPLLHLLLYLVIFSAPAAAEQRSLLIDTEQLTLQVIEGTKTPLTLEQISIGRNGTTQEKVRFDKRTPLGHFKIAWITRDTPFQLFIGFDYPNRAVVDQALADKRIDRHTYQRIRKYLDAGQTPPQRTRLGGYLGIHGIGKGDPDIHATYNWTNGCIALTNEQVEQLAEWIEVGTPIEIR